MAPIASLEDSAAVDLLRLSNLAISAKLREKVRKTSDKSKVVQLQNHFAEPVGEARSDFGGSPSAVHREYKGAEKGRKRSLSLVSICYEHRDETCNNVMKSVILNRWKMVLASDVIESCWKIVLASDIVSMGMVPARD
ncbi:hypothetical protein H5410_050415 [Solanum commersonii]|uniref:Uncharacterized protein n=1 Tax=Solanum commersonii TaxID=4109 RepID=A0A9J5WXJ2_SOLCO|nr:hypothetical protein H5410_050415 [Solanum commersonii]